MRPTTSTTSRRPRLAALLALALALSWLVATAGAAVAAPSLTASPTDGLHDGDRVSVRGSGYDTSKGIYVAYCVVPAGGGPPTPCGGGADTTGSTGASVWIADDPPPYGEDLAQPYGPGGSFDVTLTVTTTIGDHDCREITCAVVTRADHVRTGDRSQDAAVAITFAGSDGADAATSPNAAPASRSGSEQPASDPAPEPDAPTPAPDDDDGDGAVDEDEDEDEDAEEDGEPDEDADDGTERAPDGHTANEAAAGTRATTQAATDDTPSRAAPGLVATAGVLLAATGALVWRRRRGAA